MKFPGAPYGLKMACGENPKRVYGGKGRAPSTRMGNVAGYRRRGSRPTTTSASGTSSAEGQGRQAGRATSRMETLAGVLRRRDPGAEPLLPRRRDGQHDRHRRRSSATRSPRSTTPSRPTRSPTCWRDNDICAAMWADWWGFKMEAFDGIRENIALVATPARCAIVHSDSAERHPAPQPGSRQGHGRGQPRGDRHPATRTPSAG